MNIDYVVNKGSEDMEKLLPCPECGDQPKIKSLESEYSSIKYFCGNIGTHISCGDWKKTDELAIAEWNRRVREYLDEQVKLMDKEKQEFQLGDTAYMIDEDYRFFESTVKRIGLDKGKYYYETSDVDFEYGDIGEWVFKSDSERAMHLENRFIK